MAHKCKYIMEQLINVKYISSCGDNNLYTVYISRFYEILITEENMTLCFISIISFISQVVESWFYTKREKEGDLTQSYDKTPYTKTEIRKPKDNTQTPPKTSITQRLRTDLGRSVGVTSHPTGVIKPVYGYPTFPLTATSV